MNDTISRMRQEVAWGCSLADRAGERREAMNEEIVPGFDIESTEGLSISLERVEGGTDLLVLKLAGQGVKCFSVGPIRIRMVTHKDVDRAGILYALEVLRTILK